MKTKEFWFGRIGAVALLIGSLTSGGLLPRAAAQVGLSLNVNIQSPTDFYSPLAPYGSWVNVGPYGRCWRPADVSPGWQPYTMGHWEWTDAGWYWASDEPWGWACFHYGQWLFNPAYGWVWVPGTQWAPAWVVWREAPDYIGWAPCGPGGIGVAGTSFVFVDVHRFHEHLRPMELVFNDRTIFSRSRPVGSFRTERRDWDGRSRTIAVNRGPGVEPIQRATVTRFTERPVREVIQQSRSSEVARAGRQAQEQRPNANQAQPYVNRHPAKQPTQPYVNQQRQQQAPVNQPTPYVNRQQQQQPYVNQHQTQPSPERERQQLYREAPVTPPAPTGRQEQRIYREAPTTRSAPTTAPLTPVEPRVQRPAPVVTPTAVPQQRTEPPPGLARSRPNVETPRHEPVPRSEPAARMNPPQPVQPTPAPNPPPKHEGRDRERDGV